LESGDYANIVEELFAVLQARKAAPAAESYTARLLAAGEDEIIKKVGEEAVEVILAAKGQGNDRLVRRRNCRSILPCPGLAGGPGGVLGSSFAGAGPAPATGHNGGIDGAKKEAAALIVCAAAQATGACHNSLSYSIAKAWDL